MLSTFPTSRKPTEEDRLTRSSIDVGYVKSNHAAFTIGSNAEPKRSLTLGKLLEHAGFVLRPGDRFRLAIELLCFAFCFLVFGSQLQAEDNCPFTAAVAASAKDFPRGAKRSPAHHVLTAPQHRVTQAPPAEFAYVPKQLDMWGNSQYGDCVSAEEAFAKACYSPEIFIDANTVISWARKNGYLNGADLASVMDTMARGGFAVGSQTYDDGPYASVDYSNETVLQSAIATGPVKIAIDANALPKGAGNQQGWFALGGGRFTNTDHCVSICGYGSAAYLYSQLNTPLPAALPGTTSGYLVFTWGTIGFVDHPWLMSTCTEAWVRNPTTVGVPPLSPSPTPDPTPPTPTPTPGRLTFAELMQLLAAKFFPRLTPAQSAGVSDFFADDNSPRVELLKRIVYRRGLAAGVIPAGTDIGAVNWQNVIQLLIELEPLIVPLIPVLFGDEHAAAATPSYSLCAAESEKPAVKKPSPKSPQYRKECGPNGCRMVPIGKPRFKFFRAK